MRMGFAVQYTQKTPEPAVCLLETDYGSHLSYG